MRNQKGITLVALVITIIVLLILAGVSISLVVGQNGVLGKATSAVVTNKAAGVKEKVGNALAAAEMEYQSKWAQGISSGVTTTRLKVYDGLDTVTESSVSAGEVMKDLVNVYKKSSETDGYTSENVAVKGAFVSTAGAKIAIKSGSDIFVFTVSVPADSGKYTINKDITVYEGVGNANATSALTAAPDGAKTSTVELQ